MTKENSSKEPYKGRFQLSVDTDSVLISQAPNKNLSRIILANLQEVQLRQIVKSLHHAGLADRAIDLLKEEAYLEPAEHSILE